MTITVELPVEIEERFLAQAQARGISVAACVREFLVQSAQRAPRPTNAFSVTEMDRLWDEVADMLPAGLPPLSDEAMSRENIYTREDEW